MTSYIGFLPCRSGSERVLDKNMRPFAGFQNGLLELKLKQFSAVKRFEEIIVSSNDERVLEYAEAYSRTMDARVCAIPRPDELGRSSTAMDDFIGYIARMVEDGVIVWSHVTSPFITSKIYDQMIDAYERCVVEGFDSLVTVTKIHKFLWDENGPLNYNPRPIKWPRSQDIKPVFEINHGAYIMPFELMREVEDRVGRKPCFMQLPEAVAMDIDWEEQFVLLDQIARVKTELHESLI
ncbi:cytidylyltransferase domain-containing protein [Falsiroseomonas sp. E2-1-a20]|uniref:acylneuraminate cytidylyltransferase family protein n=1 Tax=Falsiroseomonas sp. E2-1-a20 TaxID=3239300 RepID=UPI003F30238A